MGVISKNVHVVAIIYLSNEIVTSYLCGEVVCFCRSVDFEFAVDINEVVVSK